MSDLSIVVVGDPLSNGGTVMSGSPNETVAGKAVARKGDLARCDKHGMTHIAEGSLNHTSGGIPVALDRHRTACGCFLIAAAANNFSNITA
ncbi:MAG: hypothetical protein NVS3B11_03200 [Collimonas sp.]